jgi:hypothetical protein
VFLQKDALSRETPVNLKKRISWLMGTLQRSLFPKLEESWNAPITEKEKQLVSILELVQVESFVPKSSFTQSFRRKLRCRESIARSFVAKSVYGYPFTSSLIEALKTSPSLRKICGFEKVSDITSESTFSRAFSEFADSGLGDHRSYGTDKGFMMDSRLLCHGHCDERRKQCLSTFSDVVRKLFSVFKARW